MPFAVVMLLKPVRNRPFRNRTGMRSCVQQRQQQRAISNHFSYGPAFINEPPVSCIPYKFNETPLTDPRPQKAYAKGSAERADLLDTLAKERRRFPVQISGSLESSVSTIPLNDLVMKTYLKHQAKLQQQVNPSRHTEVVARTSAATPSTVNDAVDHALAAKTAWSSLPFTDRADIFLRAAELIAGKYRSKLVAATMYGQGKTVREAEIDAISESVDFLRCYVYEALHLFTQQPSTHAPGTWNRMEYRSLEGFLVAIAPFNFTALNCTLVVPQVC